jgi:hypothetical protein
MLSEWLSLSLCNSFKEWKLPHSSLLYKHSFMLRVNQRWLKRPRRTLGNSTPRWSLNPLQESCQYWSQSRRRHYSKQLDLPDDWQVEGRVGQEAQQNDTRSMQNSEQCVLSFWPILFNAPESNTSSGKPVKQAGPLEHFRVKFVIDVQWRRRQ